MSGIKKKLLPAVHPAQTIAKIAVKISITSTSALSLLNKDPNHNKNANEKNMKNCDNPYKMPIILPFLTAKFLG